MCLRDGLPAEGAAGAVSTQAGGAELEFCDTGEAPGCFVRPGLIDPPPGALLTGLYDRNAAHPGGPYNSRHNTCNTVMRGRRQGLRLYYGECDEDAAGVGQCGGGAGCQRAPVCGRVSG